MTDRIEQLRQTIAGGLADRTLAELRKSMVDAARAGVSQADAVRLLQSLRSEYPAWEDRVLELMDIATGFCGAHQRIWEKESPVFQPGQRVTAEVVNIVHFGIFMRCDGQNLLVLAPDAGTDGTPVEEVFAVGDKFEVEIVRYNPVDDIFRARVVVPG